MINTMINTIEYEPATQRILVALDACSNNIAVLRAAAQLAAQLHAELHGVFVEDGNLLRLCQLPFGQEIGRFSGASRRLESQTVERQMRALAASLRQALAQVAEDLQVPWSFQVARGSVADELLAAAENALMLTLGQADRSFGNLMGDTTQAILQRSARPVMILDKEGQLLRPLTILYTGSESAQRALQLATRLAQRGDRQLQVLLAVTPAERDQVAAELTTALSEQGVRTRILSGTELANLATLVTRRQVGTLILPVEQSDLLFQLAGSMIVVP